MCTFRWLFINFQCEKSPLFFFLIVLNGEFELVLLKLFFPPKSKRMLLKNLESTENLKKPKENHLEPHCLELFVKPKGFKLQNEPSTCLHLLPF